MRIRSKYSYAFAGFMCGFILAFIGIAIENFILGYSIKIIVLNIDNYISPLVTGLFLGVIAILYWIANKRNIVENFQMLKNERRYYRLFENMTDLVCMVDNEMRITDVNSAGLEFFGYTKDEMINMTLDNFICRGDKGLSGQYFDQLEKGGKYSLYEGRIITKSGDVKWIQVNSTEVIQQGRKVGYQDIIRDITLRKEAEIELQKTVQQLNDLNSTKDKLFSIIAHDLRSPFSSILGLSGLVIDDFSQINPDKQKKYLRMIHSSADSTMHLLENLLNWAMSQTGQLSYEPVRLNITQVMNEVVDLLTPLAQVKGITIQVITNTDIELFADSNMLMTILRNLVSNAIKYSKRGGSIAMRAFEKNGQFCLSVKDNGIGMSGEMKNSLFTHKSATPEPGTEHELGSGIGLVLCKELTEVQGGKIEVESETGKGSKFTLILPIHKEVEELSVITN